MAALARSAPIGATGARLIVTLLHALEAHNLKRGVAALCIGGGEATAICRGAASSTNADTVAVAPHSSIRNSGQGTS